MHHQIDSLAHTQRLRYLPSIQKLGFATMSLPLLVIPRGPKV